MKAAVDRRQLKFCLALGFLIVAYEGISQAYATSLACAPIASPDGRLTASTFSQSHSKIFLGSLLRETAANKGMMLWAMYPASIRGRVFSRNLSISNPLESGGW